MHCTAARLLDTLDASTTVGNYRQQWALTALKHSIVKKFLPTNRTTPLQDKTALDAFLAANERCLGFAPWQRDRIDRDIDEDIKLRFFRLLAGFSLPDVYEHHLIGPRASRLCPTNDANCKFFGSPHSSTSGYLYTLYSSALRGSAVTAELARQTAFGRYTLVAGSSMSFVAKQNTTSRVICTEPFLNMVAQKSIAKVLENLLRSVYQIDLATQPDVNRAAARQGSIDGLNATIDLKSASDTISCGLISYLFPDAFCKALERTRSPTTLLKSGKLVNLNMISSMGNGFTFPLQTLIFSSVVWAVYRQLNIKQKVDVFGDDIICHHKAYNLVVHTLTRFGFIVNNEKSFSHGPFRESCGGDYVYGYDVRGVYIKRLAFDMDYISAFNRLRIWSLTHGISIFRTLLALRRCIKHPTYGPYCGDTSSAIFSTRRQAILHGGAFIDDDNDPKKPKFGLSYYRWQAMRHTTSKVDSAKQWNHIGLLLAMSTGRCVSHPVTGSILETPKIISMRRRRVLCQASVWCDPTEWYRLSSDSAALTD